MKILDYNQEVLDLTQGTSFMVTYDEDMYFDEKRIYNQLSGGDYLIEIINDDKTNNEFSLRITHTSNLSCNESYLSTNINTLSDYGYELKEVYFNNEIMTYTLEDDEKIYDASTYNDRIDLKLIYEAKIKYVLKDGHKSFIIKANWPYEMKMDGFDNDRLYTKHSRIKEREYIFYSDDTPTKLVMAGYNYYLGSIVLAYIIYITSTIVVVGKTICFFVYYKSKEVEAE